MASLLPKIKEYQENWYERLGRTKEESNQTRKFN
jgi:hypothetical protein